MSGNQDPAWSRPRRFAGEPAGGAGAELHPAWQEFIRFCSQMRFGEVERLVIQDGLPVLAEMTRKKVKFT